MSNQENILSPNAKHILRMVAYFDIFDHPLFISELQRFVGLSHEMLLSELRLLETKLNVLGDSVCLINSKPDMAQQKKKRARASKNWPQAIKYGRHLSHLPFVKGVLLTGSMSKGAVSADSDFDFLLLVEPKRVWMVKTILEVFRKSMPKPRREHYCANYILGLDDLQLQHKNVFTAIELSTAVPLFGAEACSAFIRSNQWSASFVPNQDFNLRRAELIPSISLNGHSFVGFNWTEDNLLNLWDRYWEKKYAHLPKEDREKRFRRESGKAANHLHDFQDRVIDALRNRLALMGIEEELVL